MQKKYLGGIDSSRSEKTLTHTFLSPSNPSLLRATVFFAVAVCGKLQVAAEGIFVFSQRFLVA